MTHIEYGSSVVPGYLDPDWLELGAEIRTYLSTLAARTDLVVSVGPGAAFGSPACFIPHQAEIRIDNTICLPGVDHRNIKLTDALWRLEHAPFMGAGAHEAAHAAFTRWKPEQFIGAGATAKHLDVIYLLEEPRIEHRLLSRTNGQRQFLRSSALDLILKDFTIPETPYGAAALAALVLARIDGGILEKSDGGAVRAAIAPVLPVETLNLLQNLWLEFLAIGDLDVPSMLKVSKRWLEVLHEDPDDSSGTVFPGHNSQPEGEGSWAAQAVGGAAVRAEGAIIEKRTGERNKRAQAAAEADSQRRKTGERLAATVFHNSASTDPGGTVTAHRTGERPPTAQEHRAATELAQALLVAEQRDTPDMERAPRHRPPGRLRTRAAAQAAAYTALNLKEKPNLFRARTHVPDGRGALTVATMLDISGSMKSAAEALASVQWVISTAGSRIGARTASVHFGAKVHGVAPLGHVDENVQMYDCSDPWEAFKDAFMAVDHEAQLLDGTGTRLLVIASDGNFRNAAHRAFAEPAMTMCKQAGVHVIWLKTTRRLISTYGHGSVVDVQNMPPERVARMVGATAVELLAAER